MTYSFFFYSGQSFKCPKPDGTFEDNRQCDKYYECFDGISEERLCPDGLVFDPFSNKREPCDHYFNVDCGDRLELRKFKTRVRLLCNNLILLLECRRRYRDQMHAHF